MHHFASVKRDLLGHAPGKVNLCLYLGPTREDGYHELLSLVQPVTLYDSVSLTPAESGEDWVQCDGVEGPNLAGAALTAFRAATGWDAPPLCVSVSKRIPVAAGMGGGSSDAAATLRLARHHSGCDADLVAIGFGLGADVPALLHHELTLVRGAGERVEPLPALPPFVVALVVSDEQLSTPRVFAEADRLGLGRSAEELDALERQLRDALASGAPLPLELMTNDLEPAAISLCPSIEPILETMRERGARGAMVSGSGPTVFGVFEVDPEEHGEERVEMELDGAFDEPVIASPVPAEALRLLAEAPEGEVGPW